MTTGTTPEADAVSRIEASIHNADQPVSAPVTEPAPTEAKPAEKQAAEAGKEGQAKVTETVSKETPAEGVKAEGEKQVVKEPAKVDADKNPFALPEDELHDMLGLPKPETETLESVKAKYANSSREAHRLVELEKARQDFFKSQGLRVIQDAEGKFVLAPDEDYEKKFDLGKDLNIKKMYDNLSEEDKETLVSEPEKILTKIGNKIAMELLAKRPPVSSKTIETVITTEQANEVWRNFLGSKLQDGTTPRYQDADNPAVVAIMQKILSVDSPAMDKFKKVINSDPDLNYMGLEHLYLKARNVMLESKLRQMISASQKQEQKKELEKKVAVSAGTQIPTESQTLTASSDAGSRIAQAIREA